MLSAKTRSLDICVAFLQTYLKWPKQNGPPKVDAFCQHHPAQLNLQKGQNYFPVKGRDIDQRIVDAADSVSVFCRQINDALTLE